MVRPKGKPKEHARPSCAPHIAAQRLQYVHSEVTTVMLKNIPNKYTRNMLCQVFDEDFRGDYDFLYAPIDFKNGINMGYCFVNFRSPEASQRFTIRFHGRRLGEDAQINSHKVCEVVPAHVQGIEDNVNKIRCSPVMKQLVAKPEWQPLVFGVNGDPRNFLDMPSHLTHEISAAYITGSGREGIAENCLGGTMEGGLAGQGSTSHGTDTSMTTVALYNLVPTCTQDMLIDLLNEYGFRSLYNFVYVPRNFQSGQSIGHAMVNLLGHDDAVSLIDTFHGLSEDLFDSSKNCAAAWNPPASHQGLDKLLEHYRNSSVMHSSVPFEWQPMTFEDGEPIPFPAPTKTIDAPKKIKKFGKRNDSGTSQDKARPRIQEVSPPWRTRPQFSKRAPVSSHPRKSGSFTARRAMRSRSRARMR